MKIDGGCHCGRITYEADIDPANVATCNCTDCQSLSGSAFRTIVFVPAADFHILTGTPKIYTKVGDSGNPRVQAFCDNCGSPIYACPAVDQPDTYSIRLGTARQRAELKPRKHYWHKSAVPWLSEIGTIETDDAQ